LLRAIACLMSACAVPAKPIPVSDARSHLVGLKPADVAACMGPAPIERTRANVVLWSYPSTSPGGVPPIVPPVDLGSDNFRYAPLSGDILGDGLGTTEGPLPPTRCMVNIVFDSGRVRAVTYVGPGGQLVSQGAECTALVSNCVAPP
jgi:hypothetical protein